MEIDVPPILPEFRAIISMEVGPSMDELIHRLVLKKKASARYPKYSTDVAKAIEIIVHQPIAVGQVAPGLPIYKPEHPYWAGSDQTLIVTADTPAKALCKAALCVLADKRDQEAARTKATNEAAPAGES